MTARAFRFAPQADDRYPSRIGPETAWLDRQDPIVYGTANDGPLTTMELDRYAMNGYLTLHGLFSREETGHFLEELKRLRGLEDIREKRHTVQEPESGEVRSIFAVHEHNPVLRRLCRDPRLVEIARQILGSPVYIHQSRINYKRGYRGREFYWHSDFETWHVEDGMPAMRALSCSISLTANTPHNGPLMVIPGSHRVFLACAGKTPENHYKQSLRKQEYGVPDDAGLARMVQEGGIDAPVGEAGMVTFFDCNIMHGSNSNITPLPRSNVFIVYNSVENTLLEPYCGLRPRPQFIANRRNFKPV